MSRPMPPTGADPPTEMRTATGEVIDLVPLAQEICRRYRIEFPDEEERYGAAGHAWCLHDNQYLLAWAIQDGRDGTVHLVEQALWLAVVLDKRGFPTERLARDLDVAAEVATATLDQPGLIKVVAQRLTAAANAVRASDHGGSH